MRGIVGSVATGVKLQGIEEDGPANSMPERASVHFHTWPRVVPTMCISCVAVFTRRRVCRLRSAGERRGGRSFGSPADDTAAGAGARVDTESASGRMSWTGLRANRD